ncbi:hypothetical protein DSUL_160019 [Desulfovibrionales bacterium]
MVPAGERHPSAAHLDSLHIDSNIIANVSFLSRVPLKAKLKAKI